MHLWDRLLPHAVIALNMLRTSRINPRISSATYIFGQYDFNRAPMAPPGTRIIHIKPQAEGELVLHMDKMTGTLGLLWNITDVIRFISPKLEETEL
jgi:hypothetical protein